jgi:hypothetical protein
VIRALATIGVVAIAGCQCGDKKPAAKKPPAPLTGLAAIPGDAEAVISIDVDRFASGPLVERAVALLLARDPDLRGRWEKLAASCQIDVRAQVRRITFALGPIEAGKQPVLTVITGDVAEAKLATCVRAAVGQGGGELSVTAAAGRTIYQVKEGNRTQWFAFSQADTIVMSTEPAYLERALGDGEKVATGGALKPVIARADQKAPLWAAGRARRIGDGLVKLTGGKVTKPPQAIVAALDPSTGIDIALGVELTSESDARELESFTKGQLPLLAMAAQFKALGPVVAKLQTTRDGSLVTLKAAYSVEDINQLFKAIDSPATDPQDASPEASSPDASTK